MKKLIVLCLCATFIFCSCSRPSVCKKIEGDGYLYSFNFMGSDEALIKYVHNDFPNAYGIFRGDDSSECYFFIKEN